MTLFEIPAIKDPGAIKFEGIRRLAASLGADPHALNAVCLTESTGSGFLPSGRPKILFEGHVFWKMLVKYKLRPQAYLPKYKDVLYPGWVDSFYLGGEREYTRLEKAEGVHVQAALCSASWGAFQILGMNFSTVGYGTVEEFVLAMCSGYDEQYKAFGRYLKAAGLVAPMNARDWPTVARKYNGPGYRRNRYDEEMAKNYQKSLKANPG
jgi:hypothetical protein